MKISIASSLSALLALLLVAGCSTATEEAAPASSSTAVPPAPTGTQPALAVAPAPTPVTPLSTSTLAPTPLSPEPQIARIELEPGTASATVDGRVGQLGVTRYVLGGLEGQTIEVGIRSPRSDVLLNVVGTDGTPLKRYVDGKAHWRGILPSTQDYYLEAVSIGAATGFTLRVSVLRQAPMPEPQPVRIHLENGATSATVSGRAKVYGRDLYVLQAMEGQMLTAVLSSSAADLLLEIWGADGTVLKRYLNGETAWSGALPASQDYYFEVISFGSEADYSLEITIPPP